MTTNREVELEQLERPRCNKKLMTKEVIALRSMREIRKLTRKHAAQMVGITHKTLEKIENGRINYPLEKCEKFVMAYNFTWKQFELLLEGRINIVRDQLYGPKPKVIKNNYLRRSYKRIITKEVLVIRCLRKTRGVSQDTASNLCGWPRCTFGQIENGRIELTSNRIERVLRGLGFKKAEFDRLLKSDTLRTDLIEECTLLLKKLDESKLAVAKTVLASF